MLAYMTRPPPATAGPGSGGTAMIWMTWRQFRTPALATGTLLLAPWALWR